MFARKCFWCGTTEFRLGKEVRAGRGSWVANKWSAGWIVPGLRYRGELEKVSGKTGRDGQRAG